jgi:hypothetical protein
MNRADLPAHCARLETGLSGEQLADARFEACVAIRRDGAGVEWALCSTAELENYAVELSAIHTGREASRRLSILRTDGIRAFHASKRSA